MFTKFCYTQTRKLLAMMLSLVMLINLFTLSPLVIADRTVVVPDDVFVEEAKKQLAEDFSKAADLKGEIVTQMEAVLRYLLKVREDGSLLSDAQFEEAYAEALRSLDLKITALLNVRTRIDENLRIIKQALSGKTYELEQAKKRIETKRDQHQAEIRRLHNQARALARQYEFEIDAAKKRTLARQFVSVQRAKVLYAKWDKVYEGVTSKVDYISAVYAKLPQGIESLRLALQDQFLNLELAHGFMKDAADLQAIVLRTKILLTKGVFGADGIESFVKEVGDLRMTAEGLQRLGTIDPSFDPLNRELQKLLKALEFDDGLASLSNPADLKRVEDQMKEVLGEDKSVSYRRGDRAPTPRR